MGKLIVVAALALVAGIFIGGVGPRAELARTRTELELARSAAARGGASSALPFALGLGGLVAAQKEARERAEAAPAPPRFQPPPQHPEPGGAQAAEAPARAAGGEDGGRSFAGPEAFAAARTAAALRAAQYREAFFHKAQLSREGQAAVTATVADMNRELAVAAQELTTALGDKPKIGPRDMADVGARVLDIYRRADDRFRAGLDDHGRAAADKTDFDLLTQIDLGAVEGLARKIGGMSGNMPSPSQGEGSSP
jgi:hypothetical protein